MTDLIAAFLLGGCLCALFQVIGSFTKAAPPKILLVGIAAGALLAALGVTGALGAFSPAGIGVMVIGFGGVVFDTVQAALSGVWTPTLIVIGVIVAFWALGMLSGVLRMALSREPAGNVSSNASSRV